MAYVNYSQREIHLKIVYYGCAFGGKTTNLQSLHRILDSSQKSNLITLPTTGDRTLYFDFMAVQIPIFKNFSVRFQLYTVPGQALYVETRRMVLKGVDGIVFVVDSSWDQMPNNVASFVDLQENLLANSFSLAQIPYVIQYNKRDLSNIAPLQYLEYALNNRSLRVPVFKAIANQDNGTRETFNAITNLLLNKYSKNIPMETPVIPS